MLDRSSVSLSLSMGFCSPPRHDIYCQCLIIFLLPHLRYQLPGPSYFLNLYSNVISTFSTMCSCIGMLTFSSIVSRITSRVPTWFCTLLFFHVSIILEYIPWHWQVSRNLSQGWRGLKHDIHILARVEVHTFYVISIRPTSENKPDSGTDQAYECRRNTIDEIRILCITHLVAFVILQKYHVQDFWSPEVPTASLKSVRAF
jgi:hypothetical protein